MPDFTDLDWHSVLLVKVNREPFTGIFCGLQVSRVHLALHPDGVVMSVWDVPKDKRTYRRVQLVGWKPRGKRSRWRDVPFRFPMRFERHGDKRVSSLIPNGTWMLPYDETQYQLYLSLQKTWQNLMLSVDTLPNNPLNLNFIHTLIHSHDYASSLN